MNYGTCVDNTRYNNAFQNNNFNQQQCQPYKNGCLNLNSQSGINNDECYVNYEEKNSIRPGLYQLENFHDCNCEPENIKNIWSQNPTMNYVDGHGWSACNINNDSELRKNNLTNLNCIQDLRHRPYPTVPFMGRGSGDICLESELRPGESTFQNKPCNNLAGVSIENQYTPMIPCLKQNIQNPKHIIPELSDECWKRGGQDSRQLIRNIDYLNKCGYKYNGKYWNN